MSLRAFVVAVVAGALAWCVVFFASYAVGRMAIAVLAAVR